MSRLILQTVLIVIIMGLLMTRFNIESHSLCAQFVFETWGSGLSVPGSLGV